MSTQNVYNTKEAEKQLASLDASWSLQGKGTKLSRSFVCVSPVDALSLIAKMTVHAEVLQHHPEIMFVYNKVKCVLTTHDINGLTKRDFELAKRIDRLAGKC